jgi:hypothetical protein
MKALLQRAIPVAKNLDLPQKQENDDNDKRDT